MLTFLLGAVVGAIIGVVVFISYIAMNWHR